MAKTGQDFEVYQGSDKRMVFSIDVQVSGSLVDPEVIWTLGDSPYSEENIMRITREDGDIEYDPQEEKASVRLKAEDTAKLKPRRFYHELWLVSDTGFAKPAATGNVTVIASLEGKERE